MESMILILLRRIGWFLKFFIFWKTSETRITSAFHALWDTDADNRHIYIDSEKIKRVSAI